MRSSNLVVLSNIAGCFLEQIFICVVLVPKQSLAESFIHLTLASLEIRGPDAQIEQVISSPLAMKCPLPLAATIAATTTGAMPGTFRMRVQLASAAKIRSSLIGTKRMFWRSITRATQFIAEVFGGPADYSAQHGGHAAMIGYHIGKNITEQQRQHWFRQLLETT